MEEIKIRSLTIEDLKGETGRSFYETLSALAESPIDDNKAEDTYYVRNHTGLITLVAVLNGKEEVIVGTASILIEPKFIHGYSKVAHLEDVAVAKDYQLTGIGRMLIEKAIEIAKGAGCYKIILDCSDDKTGFYEKLGFIKYNNGMRLNLT
jgi:glucosamine-phosphate N-acetyltransferase